MNGSSLHALSNAFLRALTTAAQMCFTFEKTATASVSVTMNQLHVKQFGHRNDRMVTFLTRLSQRTVRAP
ncbi:hypothetical protein BaRGS_00038487 [Batillaria attramentaria]|uniref:Uncharacterized protein n=1 Tax=Batillaria attramentaria TaxID=370345 RepID=A0ABD0J601_9CAEN